MSSSNVSSVTNYFSTVNEGFVTGLTNSIVAGAATMVLDSTTGLVNGSIFVGIIEPGVAGKEQTFTGTVSTAGNQITGVVWTRGTNTSHATGVTIVDYVTGTDFNMMTKGILTQHSQAGAHTAITATSLAATGVVNASTVSSLQDTSIPLSTYRRESQSNFTASGGIWTADAAGSTRNASMTAWTGYINGQRGTISAVTARTFTASKDTYVDVLNTSGVFTLVYTEVTNNAASPALAANSMRIAVIPTGASSIATGTINQGNFLLTSIVTGALPSTAKIAISDSLGNMIYPTSPRPVTIAGIIRNTSTTSGNPGGTHVSWNGMSGIPFIATANTNYRINMHEPALSGTSGNDGMTFEFYLGTTAGAATTMVNEASQFLYSATSTGADVSVPFNTGATYSGLVWLNIWWRTGAGFTGTMTMNANTTTRMATYTIDRL